MANFRLLNEFGVSSVVLALEPANKCACSCTYCFAELNKRAQYAGKTRRDEDPGSFERMVERASGPGYDPTDFRQWSIRNRMPIGWANTVEPFQDLPQAEGILRIVDKLSIPLFVQTKGHNFDAIWPTFQSVADNTVLFVSFPSMDNRVIKRFEPGTPKAAERIRMIETAAAAGMEVTLALAPYHEDWCADPADFIRQAAEWGVKRIFFDRLHLNDRQIATCNDPVTIALSQTVADTKFFDHALALYDTAESLGLGFLSSHSAFSRLGLVSTEPCLTPAGVFGRGGVWPYFDGHFLQELDWLTLLDETTGPVVVEWDVALAAMESETKHDQPFSMRSMSELMAVRKLAPAWISSLGVAAPAREYYRALWNSPSAKQFAWRHRSMRIAMRPDGQPWRDADGNIAAVYDAADEGPGLKRTFAELDGLTRFTWDFDDDDDSQGAD